MIFNIKNIKQKSIYSIVYFVYLKKYFMYAHACICGRCASVCAVSMYICACIRVCVCVWVCLCEKFVRVYLRMSMRVYRCVKCASVCSYMFMMHVCACRHVCVCVCICVCTCVCVCIH